MYRFFFFNDTATTEIYTLSLHDALPICDEVRWQPRRIALIIDTLHLVNLLAVEVSTINHPCRNCLRHGAFGMTGVKRSEEHTSELQSRQYLVCRLLLEKKKKQNNKHLLA